MLLSTPTYFKLKETEPGTVLIEKGVFQKEDISAKYGNRQFYFYDENDSKLKCISGGQFNYIFDMHSIDASKVIKVTYAGEEAIQNGKFAGSSAHQFDVEMVEERAAVVKPQVVSEPVEADDLD